MADDMPIETNLHLVTDLHQDQKLNEDQTEQLESYTRPPTSASEIPTWAAGMALGDQLAQDFIDRDPAWAAALEELEMTEEQLGDLLGGIYSNLFKEMGKSMDFYEELDDGEKSPAEMTCSGY